VTGYGYLAYKNLSPFPTGCLPLQVKNERQPVNAYLPGKWLLKWRWMIDIIHVLIQVRHCRFP